MKKTILCLLLALCLLMMSAAAMADDDIGYRIDNGDIIITDGADEGTLRIQQGSDVKDNVDPGTTIYVGGAYPPDSTQIIVNAKVPVKITYAVHLLETILHSVISIADYSDVTLTLSVDPCDVKGTGSEPAIKLGSGSKLTVKGAEDGREELCLFSGQSAILGPTDSETPATVILNSGIVDIFDSPGSGISRNVNLVINGGTVKANGKDIDVNSLIVTGGELWAGSDSSTKVTYDNLSSYTNIKCEAGILPDTDNILAVFGNATLPVDLTIPGDRALYFRDESSLTIPEGKTLTFAMLAEFHMTDSASLTNYGTLDILGGETQIFGTLNNYGTMITHLNVSMMGISPVLNNYGTLIIEDNKLSIGQGTFNNTGTISGGGSLYPPEKRPQLSAPTFLKVERIENNTVTLSVPANANATAEYSLDKTNWQDEPEFTGGIPDAGQTFYARYKENKFFKASGDTSVSIYPVTLHPTADSSEVGYYIAGQGATLPTDVKRENYTFAGWYDNSACTGTPITEITKKDNTAKTFWAKWTPDTYTLTLDANGGTINSGDLNSYTFGVGATLPTDVQKENYKFAGWYDNEALTGSPVTAIGATETGERKYWAKWTPDTYNLTLNTNGGTINSGDLNSYTYGEGATLPTDVTRQNYTFAGWHDNEALTGDPVTQIGATETGERKYWAKWTADDFTVTLNTNGGTINSGNVTGYPFGVGATLPTDVTRTGYTFAGWYDNEALTGDLVTAIGATETGAKEYWAKWRVVNTDPDGMVVSGEAAFAKLPPVTVPTLVLPEGTTLGGSVMLKYVEVATTRENTAVYDVYLVDQDGNRVKLPTACTLCLPYPQGLNQSSASVYRIHILHEMDGGRSEDFDSVSGSLTLTAQGLCVRISSLSPFTITWERFPEVNLPQTGDSSHPGLWLALGLLSIAALAALALRGRKNGRA